MPIISPIAASLINHNSRQILQPWYTQRNKNEFAAILDSYLIGLNELIGKKSAYLRAEWVQNHLSKSFKTFPRFAITMERLSKLKALKVAEHKSAEILGDSTLMDFFAMGLDWHKGVENLFPFLKEFSNHLKNQIAEINEVESFFRSSKGPKTDLRIIIFKNSYFEMTEFDNFKMRTINLREPFDGCFLSTKLETNLSKANNNKFLLLALNLSGIRCTERQLRDTLRNYEKMSPRYKSELFLQNYERIISDCEYLLK